MDEIDFITDLTKGFVRAPDQLNSLLESDAELIPIPQCDGKVLAVTADSIVEEIATGLYEDPYLIGWMTVVSSLSDLAAVGARPLGILVVQHFPEATSSSFIERMQLGIRDAVRAGNTFVLGGDVGFSNQIHCVGVAVGILERSEAVTRRGAEPGDFLFSSAAAGLGNAYAFAQLTKSVAHVPRYLPKCRLREARLIGRYASSCIDTSDGLIPAIATLVHLNNTGVAIPGDLRALVHADARTVVDESGLPPWFFLAGPHGDFELLFTVSPANARQMLDSAGDQGWEPVPVGTIERSPGLQFDPGCGCLRHTDPRKIAALYGDCGGDRARYLQSLWSFHREILP